MNPVDWIVFLVLLAKFMFEELICGVEGLNIVELVMCAVLR